MATPPVAPLGRVLKVDFAPDADDTLKAQADAVRIISAIADCNATQAKNDSDLPESRQVIIPGEVSVTYQLSNTALKLLREKLGPHAMVLDTPVSSEVLAAIDSSAPHHSKERTDVDYSKLSGRRLHEQLQHDIESPPEKPISYTGDQAIKLLEDISKVNLGNLHYTDQYLAHQLGFLDITERPYKSATPEGERLIRALEKIQIEEIEANDSQSPDSEPASPPRLQINPR